MKIIKNKVVSLTYELRVESEGEIIEKITKRKPLKFIYGTGEMMDSFEKSLKGLKPGDKFEFIIECNEAYGPSSIDSIVEIPLKLFKSGASDKYVPEVGDVLPLQDHEGNEFNGIVLELKKTSVIMDFNHPLADQDLFFKGEILEVRDATKPELKNKKVNEKKK